MPNYIYNPSNTEGKYPTSFDFIDTEIKKDDEIVATDIPDLYDVDVTYPVNDGSVLVYNSIENIWKAGEGGGGACNIVKDGPTIYMYVDYNHTDEKGGKGTLVNPFTSLNNSFKYLLEKCKMIKETDTLYIFCNNPIITIDEVNFFNNPHGHRIIVLFGADNTSFRTTYNLNITPEVFTGDINYPSVSSYNQNYIETSNDHTISIMALKSIENIVNYQSSIPVLEKMVTNDDILVIKENSFFATIYPSINYYDNNLYIYGGYYDNLYLESSVMIRLDMSTNITTFSDIDTRKVYNQASFNHSSDIYYFGGNEYIGGLWVVISSLYRYDCLSNTIEEVPQINTPPGRVKARVLQYSNDIFIMFGGIDEYDNPLIDCLSLDITTLTWSSLSNMNQTFLSYSAEIYNSNVYVYGINISGVGQIVKYDIVVDVWSNISPVIINGVIPNLKGMSSIIIDHEIFYYGGVIDTTFNESVFIYDILNNTWRQTTLFDNEVYEANFINKAYCGYTSDNDLLYMLGGNDSDINISDRLIVYNKNKKYFNVDTRTIVEEDYIEQTIDDFNSIVIKNNSGLTLYG